jgi:hypothetical protein
MAIEEIDDSEQLQYAMSFTHQNGTGFDICPGINVYNEALADIAYQDFMDYLMAWPKLGTENPISSVKTRSQGYRITPTPPPE